MSGPLLLRPLSRCLSRTVLGKISLYVRRRDRPRREAVGGKVFGHLVTFGVRSALPQWLPSRSPGAL